MINLHSNMYRKEWFY